MYVCERWLRETLCVCVCLCECWLPEEIEDDKKAKLYLWVNGICKQWVL